MNQYKFHKLVIQGLYNSPHTVRPADKSHRGQLLKFIRKMPRTESVHHCGYKSTARI